MALDYTNERYVRLYTRDTATWKLIDWRARTVLLHLLRKVDRAGVLDVGDDGDIGLAAVLELPLEDIVQPGIAQLVKRGTVVYGGSSYTLPNFIEAQEAPASDRQRQRDMRERRRAASIDSRDGTSRIVTDESRSVTERHDLSQHVTSCHSEPSQYDPREREPDASRPADGHASFRLDSQPQRAAKPVRTRQVKHALPADWTPTLELVGEAKRLGVDLEDEIARMRDWAAAEGARKCDWTAAARNWIRRAAAERRPTRPQTTGVY